MVITCFQPPSSDKATSFALNTIFSVFIFHGWNVYD